MWACEAGVPTRSFLIHNPIQKCQQVIGGILLALRVTKKQARMPHCKCSHVGEEFEFLPVASQLPGSKPRQFGLETHLIMPLCFRVQVILIISRRDCSTTTQGELLDDKAATRISTDTRLECRGEAIYRSREGISAIS
jgi:hypothetical protein